MRILDGLPWFAVIALAGIVMTIIVVLVNAVVQVMTGRHDKELRAALDASNTGNHQVNERLAQIEQRLASIERTLTDIP